jgi:hypothetical protein
MGNWMGNAMATVGAPHRHSHDESRFGEPATPVREGPTPAPAAAAHGGRSSVERSSPRRSNRSVCAFGEVEADGGDVLFEMGHR